MTTFLSILGITLILLFLKFIWDSYLTDNTERRWSEYKRSFPIEANLTEMEPLSMVPKHLKSKPGSLADRFPSFVRFFNELNLPYKAQVTANDATRFEFKMPIKLFKNTVGYNHVGLLERNQSFEMYFYSISVHGKKLTLPPISIAEDLTISEYEDILYRFSKKMMENPKYHTLALGKDFQETKVRKQKKSLIEVGFDSLKKGHTDEAIMKFKKALELNPNEQLALLLLTDAYLVNGNLSDATLSIGLLKDKIKRGEIILSEKELEIFESLKSQKTKLRKQKRKEI